MKYLVTGGLGVIGSRFVEVVARDGHQVTIIDAAEEPRNHWMRDFLLKKFGQQISVMEARVEHTNFGPLLRTHDAILHAAAHTGIPHSEKDPHDDWVSNVDASRNILEYMRLERSKIRVVMLSSVKPYRVHDIAQRVVGDRTLLGSDELSPLNAGIDERCLLEPDEPYAASKMAQSALVMAYARTYDLPVTVLRCSILYGDAPCPGPRHGWLTWFCISAALGWPLEVQGTGLQTRDMLFSDDVASATLAALDNMNEAAGNVYNIGGGPAFSISVRESVDMIRQIRNIETRTGPGRRNEDMVFMTNYDKFTAATGWVPLVGVREGAERIIRWASLHADDLRALYKDYI